MQNKEERDRLKCSIRIFVKSWEKKSAVQKEGGGGAGLERPHEKPAAKRATRGGESFKCELV